MTRFSYNWRPPQLVWASQIPSIGRAIRTREAPISVVSRFLLRGAVLGLLALTFSAFSAGTSEANEYEVWSCLGPQGQPLSMAAWTPRTSDAATGDVSMTDTCATGGQAGLHVNNAGVTGGRRARIDLKFDLPRGGEIAGYTLNRAITAAAAFSGYTYAAAVRETDSGTTFDFGCASYLALPSFNCSTQGSHVNPTDPGNQYVRSGLALDELELWAACLSNGCAPPISPPAARLSLFQSVVSVVDNDPPNVVRLGGALTRPAPVTGTVDLYVDASDDNAGVQTVSLAIDGTPAQTITIDTPPTCAEPFEVTRPCPAQTGQIFPVDTGQLTAGTHSATGLVTDAAGNTTPFGPVQFTVGEGDSGPEIPDNGTPAVQDPILKLDRDLVEHAAGKAGVLTGRLTTGAGTAIAGAKLEVTSSALATRRTVKLPTKTVTTGSDGRFSISSEGQGARRVDVSYAPVLGGAASRSVSATVRSRLSIRMSAEPRRIRIGKSVTFKGQIGGGGPSVAGAAAEIQAISSGRWQTVANVRVKQGGKFVWKYRFRYVERDAIFSFRALVRDTPGWPWPTTQSKKIKVRIKVPDK